MTTTSALTENERMEGVEMAKKYIDSDAAVEAVFNLYPKVDDDGYCWVIRGDAARAVDDIPAADVVEVVRCGQCKHCVEHYDTDGNAPYWTCQEWDSGTNYDGYCYYGERKDGGCGDG